MSSCTTSKEFNYMRDLGDEKWQKTHDGVIKWKHFPRYWPFVRGNSPVTGEFPTQRPVARSFDVFFDLRLTERLSKQSWGWWFDTPSRPLWRHSNDVMFLHLSRKRVSVIVHQLISKMAAKLQTINSIQFLQWKLVSMDTLLTEVCFRRANYSADLV